MIEKVRNLNDICFCSRRGIYKHWILNQKSDYQKMCDYLQKINFSIQDLNSEISNLDEPHMRSIIYVIILVVWIQEAYEKIENLYRKDLMSSFTYHREAELQNAKKYINAIRSFAVAHPLSTNRHPQFGFDGNFICVDIRTFQNDVTSGFIKSEFINELRINGLQANGNRDCDFYFYVYSDKDDGMRFFRYIGCNFRDIYHVADIYVDKLYELNNYLKKQKKNDYR